jgi:hypothetical protein
MQSRVRLMISTSSSIVLVWSDLVFVADVFGSAAWQSARDLEDWVHGRVAERVGRGLPRER